MMMTKIKTSGLPHITSHWPWLLLALALALAGCGSQGEAGEEAAQAGDFGQPLSNQTERHDEGEHDHADDYEFTTDMTAVVVPSEVVLGPNRFAVGLLDLDGVIIDDAQVHFHYYDLTDTQNAFIESEADAVPVTSADGQATIYAHERDFERSGLWGLEIEARRRDGTILKQRIGFEVAADSQVLMPGDPAPDLGTEVLADVNQDPRRLSSATEPYLSLHQISLRDALANGKPTVFLMATPAFCQTRFCGPAYETVGRLADIYGDEVNFVYSEVFKGLPDPALTNWQPSLAAEAFHIESEPWIYFIDSTGLIVYRLEGLFSEAEVQRHLEQRLNVS